MCVFGYDSIFSRLQSRWKLEIIMLCTIKNVLKMERVLHAWPLIARVLRTEATAELGSSAQGWVERLLPFFHGLDCCTVRKNQLCSCSENANQEARHPNGTGVSYPTNPFAYLVLPHFKINIPRENVHTSIYQVHPKALT